MGSFLLAVGGSGDFWYAVPLVIVVSLVYSAIRHEATVPILQQAWRTAVWITGFMAAIFIVLAIMTWYLRST
ncbi:MAG: hypothetical protein JW809_15310 [Pirellulales bacterium]|nr:hypothetical protein [Pirellulales bacterium]